MLHVVVVVVTGYVKLFAIVWFQKIPIPSPWRVIGNFEGKGGLKTQSF